ncbi:MAG: hypothetical protein ACLFWG_00050 [Longimicrobiales bacterium]
MRDPAPLVLILCGPAFVGAVLAGVLGTYPAVAVITLVALGSLVSMYATRPWEDDDAEG